MTQYRSILERHVLPVIGHVKLTELRAHHVDQVMRAMQQYGLSVSTMRQARRVLSVALASADRECLIPYNPVSKTRPPTTSARSQRRVQPPYTLEEAKALLAACDEDPRRPHPRRARDNAHDLEEFRAARARFTSAGLTGIPDMLATLDSLRRDAQQLCVAPQPGG